MLPPASEQSLRPNESELTRLTQLEARDQEVRAHEVACTLVQRR
jgi:hypothetical protein